MGDQQLYCDGPGTEFGEECGREVAGHGGKGTGTPKCSTHIKQLQRAGRMTPIEKKVSPEEHALNAMNALAESDSDEEYETCRRAALAAVKSLGGRARRDAIKEGMANARARGVRLGRPPATDRAIARVLYVHLGASATARELGVSRAAVYRAVMRGAK